MTPKPRRSQATTSQLDLPFVQPGTAGKLSFYIGICKVFAAYHKRWPTREASREEFRAARLQDYDGQRLDRELRFPGPELEADPAYQELRERCIADGVVDGVSLDALAPRYRNKLQEEEVARLFDTIALPGPADAGAVRYATGLPTHAQGELTLRFGEAIRARSLRRAGRDPDDPRTRLHAFSVRVQVSHALKGFTEHAGMLQLPRDQPLADHYLLEADDGGRLAIRYQLRTESRYVGSFEPEKLVDRLAAVFAQAPALERLPDAPRAEQPAAPAIADLPAPQSEEELREQFAMLEADGQSVKLPIQALSRYAEIKSALEKAGGVYRTHKQRFEFEEGIDTAAVLDRLIHAR